MEKKSSRARIIVDSVGLGAVVFSLIFVGVEVRQNTAATLSATQQAVFEGAQGGIITVMGNERLREVLIASEDKPDWVAEHNGTPDYLLLYHFYMNRFNYVENVRFHFLGGTYPPESWAGTDGWVRSIASSPVLQHFWGELRTGYPAEMGEYMDSVIASAR